MPTKQMIEKLETHIPRFDIVTEGGLTLLKMRGSAHDHDIHAFNIDGQGMHIGEPFRTVSGILAGHPVYLENG